VSDADLWRGLALAAIGLGGLTIVFKGSGPGNMRTSANPGPQADRGSGTNSGAIRPGVDVMLGLPTVPEHRQRYGAPNGQVPTNWARTRVSYPREPCPVIQRMTQVPVNSPAFPKCDYAWLYPPPEDVDY
jgi:hypothetical protein